MTRQDLVNKSIDKLKRSKRSQWRQDNTCAGTCRNAEHCERIKKAGRQQSRPNIKKGANKMNITVSTKEKAWQLADKLFPTDYMKDEHDSPRAGYPVFNTTSTDNKYTGFHISDLNTALELNMGAETIRINIVDQEAEIKNNFDKLLQYVSDKRKSAELHERQKYNYYCDRQAGCWNWTKEQDEAYQKEWDDIIIQMHALKDLENAMNLARTKGII